MAQNSNYGVPYSHKNTGDQLGYGSQFQHSSDQVGNPNQVPYYQNNSHQLMEPNSPNMYGYVNTQQHPPASSWNWHTQQQPLQQPLPAQSHQQSHIQHYSYQGNTSDDAWNWGWDEPKDQNTNTSQQMNSNVDSVWNWSCEGYETSHGQYSAQNNNVNLNVSNEYNPAGTNSASNQHFYPQYENNSHSESQYMGDSVSSLSNNLASQLTIDDTYQREMTKQIQRPVRAEELNVDSGIALEAENLHQDTSYMHNDDNLSDKSKLTSDVSEDVAPEPIHTTAPSATLPELDHDGEDIKKDCSDLNQNVSTKIQENTDYDQCATGTINSTETTNGDVENIEIVPPEVHKDSWPSVSSTDGNAQNMNTLSNISGSVPRQNHKYQPSTVHMDTSNLFGNNDSKPPNSKLRGSAVQPDDSANLETLPDNKERPDLVDYQMSPKLKSIAAANSRNKFVQDVGQRGLQQQMYSASPENLEIAPRCGPDRNQYLETGQLSEDVNPVLGFHRMIPGQTEGGALIPPPGLHRMVQGEGEPVGAEIPPPGLKRMIPGESSSPESGGTFSAPVDPMEPRVVTGVDQDDESASQMPSPPLPISDGDLSLELTSQTTNSIAEPFSERSETIGSDNVDDYVPSSVDSAAREQSVGHREDSLKDIDRRSIEISYRDTSTKDVDMHGMESPHRDDRMYYNQSPSWSRDDRVWRNPDDIDNGSKRGQRTNSRDYRRYNEQPDDELSVDDYKRHSDRNSEQFGDHPRKDRLDAYDMQSHKKSHRERQRPQQDVRQMRSRDRHVNRNGRNDDRRRHYEYGMDNEYGHDDYYSRYYSHDMNSLDSQRSQPTSRPDSRPEFDYHTMRRDYRSYEAFPPYGVQGMDPNQYGSFYKFLMNMREKNPAAYADWYRNYVSQQNHFQMVSYPDERGSVHSGRSSVNEDRHRQGAYQHGFYRPPAYYPDFDSRRFNSGQYYDHSRRSSQSGDLEPKSSYDEHVSQSPVNVTGITSPERLTPVKFPAAHVKGLWSIGGKLLNVLSNNPIEHQPASIEILDCRPLFDFDELRDYPGPLIKGVTHKKSVIAFCLNKIKSIEDDPTVVDKTSVILIWKFLVLLLTQNGALVGTDIADLLLSFTSETSHAHIFSPYQASNIESDTKLSVEEVTNKFRDLLLLGNKKEALAWAVKHGLWGHALFLSSKIGKKMHMEVMMAFANRIPMNDPLQTLYQHLSGRVPAAVTCCADEKWGDWKVHLAMMIANSQDGICEQDCRAYITLGDTLASKGLLHASHFCYLMGQQEFGAYSDKGTKIALIGATHTKTFQELTTNEAIQMTEIYEYACQLGDPSFSVNHMMVYKLLYATRLAECGMFDASINYLEAISKSVLAQRKPAPRAVIKEVYQLAEILLNSDQVLSTPEGDDTEPNNPIWLQKMRDLYSQCYDLPWMENSQDSHPTSNQEETEMFPEVPNQMSTPQKSYYGNEVPDMGGNYLIPQPYDESENSGFENIPTYMEGPPMEINQTDYWAMNPPNAMMTTPEESHMWPQNTQESDVQEVPQSWEPPITTETEESLEARSTTPDTTKPKKDEVKQSDTSSRSWFGNILSKLSFVPKNQMKLPDDRNPSIVWNPEKNRWTNVDGGDDDAAADIPPPPKASAPVFQGEASTNKFKMAKMRSARANYVDVFAATAKRSSAEDISQSSSNHMLGDENSRSSGSSNLLDVSQTSEGVRHIPFDTKNIFVPSNIETPDHGTFAVANTNGSTMAPQVEEAPSIPAIPMYSTQKQNAPSGMQAFQSSPKPGSRLTARHKMMAPEQKQYSVNQQQQNQEPGNSQLQPPNQKFNQYF